MVFLKNKKINKKLKKDAYFKHSLQLWFGVNNSTESHPIMSNNFGNEDIVTS